MRRTRTIGVRGLIAALIATSVGCASGSDTRAKAAPDTAPVVLAGLVAGGLPAAEPGWEAYRHDNGMGLGRSSGIVQVEVFQERTWDRTRTSNGRPRDHSRTTTRSTRYGVLRTR